jgi:Protein kinase domain
VSRLQALVALSALAAAGCARVEGLQRVTEARVLWEGHEAAGWKAVPAPGYAAPPPGGKIAMLEWTLPPNTTPGLNVGFVPRREFQLQLDDGPKVALRPTWTLLPVPADGRPHTVRVWTTAHRYIGVDALIYGPGAAALFGQMRAEAPPLMVASAYLFLAVALLLLSVRARAPVPLRAIAALALCLAIIDLGENDAGNTLVGLPVLTWFALHELASLLPAAAIAAFTRGTLGDTRFEGLRWAWRLTWALAAAHLALWAAGSMFAASLRELSFLLIFATLALSARVAWRQAKAGSILARPVLWGLGLIVISVVPGMLEGVGLVNASGLNVSRWGVLAFIGSLGYALVLADRAQAEALRLRVLELEKSRSEIEALNTELRRQVADKSRALAAAIESSGPTPQKLPAVGEVFDGRYVVLRLVGRGGMGAVFEVRRIADKKPFALKLMTGRFLAEDGARFLREAEIAARIQHPNLVSVVDVGATAAGTLFLVMELVPGWSLERLEEKWKQRSWALEVLLQIARGMRALHKEGVVHRDLKPANVLVDESAEGKVQVKLTDFGIAHQRVATGSSADTLPASSSDRGHLTRAGETMGTPQYLPPDLVGAAHTTTPEADAFSFGVMACELLCGQYPFAVPPALEVMAGRLPGPADTSALHASGLPPRLVKLLERALSITASERPSAGDFIAALDEALEAEVSGAKTQRDAQPNDPSRTTRS